jgi:arabinogalactan endo-1,4-beta-galactosidase
MMGVDISSVQEAVDEGAIYVDTDGVTKSMLALLKNHGFNTVRLRTFVDPMAAYGYARGTGGACLKREAYCDRDHTLEFGRAVKDAGMRFLLDFHYSDTWADPGKQIIPEAWRSATSIEELAELLKTYTSDVVSTLVAGGARPDMVQIGNEITPGMLMHVPTASTDCWGNNSALNALNGSTSHWNDLARLLRAGIEGVKDVDDDIQIMLHLENTESKSGVIDWIENAQARGVQFDVLGLSCYPTWQGQPEIWRDTFETVAEAFPDLSFVIAEYNPEPQAANRIMRDLPDARGRGTFLWEPTLSGVWGPAMFTLQNGVYHANPEDFGEFDALKVELGL